MERKLYESAKKLLEDEISFALGKTAKEIETEIHTKLEPFGASIKIKHITPLEEDDDEDDDLMDDLNDRPSKSNDDSDDDNDDDSDDLDSSNDMDSDEDFDDEF